MQHNFRTRKNSGRHINKVLLLDKPDGMTSNRALQIVKSLFRAAKAGHTGSLDPLANGMLPICFGEATKFAQFLLDADKSYQVIAKLGEKTTTGDREGEVVQRVLVPKLTAAKIEEVLQKFRGDIMQVPSMYSAIKHNGQPLHKLAREGIIVEREARPLKIHELTLSQLVETPNLGLSLELTVRCSKGTYIRTLIEDIGDALGCGAHVIFLRRLTVGNYAETEMIPLVRIEELAAQTDYTRLDALLVPLETMLVGWKEIAVPESCVYYMRQGHAVLLPHAPSSGLLKLKSKDGSFLGVGEILPDGKVTPRRLLMK